MKFRTEIEVERSRFVISHADKLMLVGSCFSDNIGKKLQGGGFYTDINPMGIVYNPASVKVSLQRILSGRPYESSEFYLHNGVWHTFDHHGQFSHADKNRCIEQVNEHLNMGHGNLKNANCLLVTFGTAWVYHHLQLNKIVSNCHKYPASDFKRERLSVDTIVAEWTALMVQLQTFNPSIQIIFTVSPVRHWKDGAHGNQISKSILHLAVDAICEQHNNCSYFPSYELVLDDLRDYRFFADDLLHPNEQAVQYIWEKFSTAYFSNYTLNQINQIQKIKRAAAHRPLKPDTDEYRKFAESQLKKIEAMLAEYPNLGFDQEIKLFRSVLG